MIVFRFPFSPFRLSQPLCRDMYPAGASAPLPDELVHGWQGLEESKVFPTLLHRWQVDIRCLTPHVLTVGYTTHCLVEFWATITAIYADWPKPITQRLQYHVAQVSHVQHLFHTGAFILNAKSLGGVRASHLAQTEIV